MPTRSHTDVYTEDENRFELAVLFISKFSMQQCNSKIVKYAIQFLHTWILKDEQVATYIAPEETN